MESNENHARKGNEMTKSAAEIWVEYAKSAAVKAVKAKAAYDEAAKAEVKANANAKAAYKAAAAEAVKAKAAYDEAAKAEVKANAAEDAYDAAKSYADWAKAEAK